MLTLNIRQEYAWVRGPAQRPPLGKVRTADRADRLSQRPQVRVNSDCRSGRRRSY